MQEVLMLGSLLRQGKKGNLVKPKGMLKTMTG